jgi:uncharacterized protein
VSDPTLKERLAAEMTEALRAGEKVRLGALRMLSAAVTNREKELRHDLSDDEVRDVAAKERKKRTESIEAFENAGRRELAAKERAEQDAIASYAPERLSEDQVDALVDEALAATGATSETQLGAVMGYAMGKAKGRAASQSPPPPPPSPPVRSAPTKIVTVLPWITIRWLRGSWAST